MGSIEGETGLCSVEDWAREIAGCSLSHHCSVPVELCMFHMDVSVMSAMYPIQRKPE